MNFQAYARKLKKYYEKSAVISYEKDKYRYEDCLIIPHNLKLDKYGFGLSKYVEYIKKISSEIAEKLEFKDYNLFTPFHINKANRLLIGKQIFKKFYEPQVNNIHLIIVFHFRTLVREVRDIKNYKPNYFEKIIIYLVSKGY